MRVTKQVSFIRMASTLDQIETGAAALLVMDHQNMLVQGYMADPSAHLAAVSQAIAKAHSLGIQVIYIQKSFRVGYPEVHENNTTFCGVKAGGRLLETDDATKIPDEIAPSYGDIVVQGHRISAFEGTELSLLLRAQKIDTLILFGITTSGVVLSTVRQAGDMDFRMFVLRDLCGDKDQQVHDFLLDKIISLQACVLDSSEFLGL